MLLISPALRHDDVGGITTGVERLVRGDRALAPGTVAWVTAGEG